MPSTPLYCERCGYKAGLCQCAVKALVAHNNQQAAKSICRGDSMPIMGGRRKDDPPVRLGCVRCGAYMQSIAELFLHQTLKPHCVPIEVTATTNDNQPTNH